MSRAAALLLVLPLAGCAFPFPDCTPVLASFGWEQRAVYDALADPAKLRLGSVTQDVLSPGIPASSAIDAWPSGVLREVRFVDPPLPPGEEIERHIDRTHARQGGAFAPTGEGIQVSFGFFPEDPDVNASLDRFLAGAIDAPQAERDALAREMRAVTNDGGLMRSFSATTRLPVRADALAAQSLAAEGEPRVEDFGRQVVARWSTWTLVVDVPARAATFGNDDGHRTTTTADDGLPYFKLYATQGGRLDVVHGEGNSRFAFDEREAMRWANESFPLAGLPAPTLDAWRAEWATCI